MPGTTRRELVGLIWATAYSNAPEEEKQRRYRMLLDQIEVHCGWCADYPLQEADNEIYARLAGTLQALMADARN